ncbi:peptidoglycan/xylan/chitin deacetylase (PgdA/CDA1 family) [Streptacidiphilus sp. MAP12-16]|uniref:polysaccharide deacetylase family protein n=1 Tax=Streptacidiphilus sp. MAP12-16 TaxID=3156300 RepID=UPI003511E4FD
MTSTEGSLVSRRALFSLGGLLVVSALANATPAAAEAKPRPRRRAADPEKPQFYVHQGPRAIALTIDDGPHPEWTPQVLGILGRHGITATFCQVGEQMQAYPTLVRRVAAEGHLIANHTWTHPDLARVSPGVLLSEIERTSAEILRITGTAPGIFRAPYGVWTAETFAACRQLGLRPVDWSVDPRDWSRPGTAHIVREIEQHTHGGSIILEHDGGGDRSETVAALRIAIPWLLDQGYYFVTP